MLNKTFLKKTFTKKSQLYKYYWLFLLIIVIPSMVLLSTFSISDDPPIGDGKTVTYTASTRTSCEPIIETEEICFEDYCVDYDTYENETIYCVDMRDTFCRNNTRNKQHCTKIWLPEITYTQNTTGHWVNISDVVRITKNSDDITFHYDGIKGEFDVTFETGVIYDGNYYSMYDVKQMKPELEFNFPTEKYATHIKYAVNITNINLNKSKLEYITLTYKEHNGFTLEQFKNIGRRYRVKGIMDLLFDDLIETDFSVNINKSEKRVYIGDLNNKFIGNSLYLDPTITIFSDATTTGNVTLGKFKYNDTKQLEINKYVTVVSATLNVTGYQIEEGDYITSVFDTIGNEQGIHYNGSLFWIVQIENDPDEVHTYYENGTATGDVYSLASNREETITGNGTDFWTSRYADAEVYHYDSDFNKVSEFPIPHANFNQRGIDFNGTFLFMAEDNEHAIHKYYPNGTYAGNFSVPADIYPTGIAYKDDYLYFADYGDDTIYKYNTSGNQALSFPIIGSFPNGIDIYGDYLYYLRDTKLQEYYVGALAYPSGVKVDVANDSVYEFNQPSEFDTENITSDFTSTLNTYLSSCTADADENCEVPVSFSSDSAGVIQYSDISIVYDITNMTISDCTVLNEEYGTYYLNQSITDSTTFKCMEITANHVTLDCQGYTIDGDDSTQVGISIDRDTDQIANVTIENCGVTDWSLAGVYVTSDANQITIENVNSSSNDIGFDFTLSDGNTLYNVTADSNSLYGLSIDRSTSYIINNSKFLDNTKYDVWFSTVNLDKYCTHKFIDINGTDYLPIVFYNNTASIQGWNNNASEIILCNADDSIINNITLDHTGTENNGLLLIRTDNTNITNSWFYDLYNGIYSYYSWSNIYSNITSDSNTGDGFSTYLSYNNTISNLSTSYNGVNGIQIGNTRYNLVYNSTSKYNYRGLLYQGGNVPKYESTNVFKNIIISSNTDTGVYLNGPEGGTLFGLTISNQSGSGDRGVYLTGTTENVFIVNSTFDSNYYSFEHDTNSFNNTFFNNILNTTNTHLKPNTPGDIPKFNKWNTTIQVGTNIFNSNNPNMGGNYWTNSTNNGYSETCTDGDYDGFCDDPYNVTTDSSCTYGVDCGATPNVDYLPLSDEYDGDAPNFTSHSNNNSAPYYTENINLSITVGDIYDIDYVIFSTNDSGSWANHTFQPTATSTHFNYTNLNVQTAKNKRSFYAWFANDSNSNLNRTQNGTDAYYFFKVQNSVPVVSSTTWNDTTDVKTNHTVNCSISASDADSDSMTFFYKFYDDGSTNGTLFKSLPELDLSTSGFDVGDIVGCAGLAGDGDGNSTWIATSTNITIANTAPTFTGNPTINDTSPQTNDIINCSVTGTTYSDADNDADEFYFKWYEGGTLLNDIQTTSNSTLDLGLPSLDKGDEVGCLVLANDGTDNSTSWLISSTNATIDNTIPTIAIDTTFANTTNNHSMITWADFSDADGDADMSACKIFVQNTTGWSSETPTINNGNCTTLLDYSIDGYIPNVDLGITIQVYDGDDYKNSTASNNTLVNHPPTMYTGIINNTIPYTNEPVNCSVTATDSDTEGDTFIFYYKWYNSSVTNNSIFTSSVLDLSTPNWNRDNDVGCLALVYDGYDNSSWFTSTQNATIQNTAPTMSTAVINDTTPYTNEPVNCSITATDADADTFTFFYIWYNSSVTNSSTFKSLPALDLSTPNWNRGNTVGCLALVYDETVNSSWFTSTINATIQNSVPIVATAVINDTTPQTNDFVNCTMTASDIDNDALTFYYNWYNSSVNNLTIFENPILDLSTPNWNKGNDVGCLVISGDGTGNSTSFVSTVNATIANTISTINIDTTFVNTTNNHSMITWADFSDVDGDVDMSACKIFIQNTTGWASETPSINNGNCSTLLDYTEDGYIPNVDLGVTIQVYDGNAYKNSTAKNNTLVNRIPTINTPSLAPATPIVTQELNCTVSGYSDTDSDALNKYYFRWYKDDAISTILERTAYTMNLSVSNTSTDDYWKCGVISFDSWENSSEKITSNVLIGSDNTAPVINYSESTTALTTINSTSTNPTNNNSWVNFTVTSTDYEADTKKTFICKTDSFDAGFATCDGGEWCSSDSSTDTNQSCRYDITGSETSESYSWYAFVRDNLGLVSSSFEGTFIVNHPPTISTLNITETFPHTLTNLNCNYTFSDIDAGDTDNTNFVWFNVTSTPLKIDKDNSVLTLGNTTKGEDWLCQATPKDNHLYSGIVLNSSSQTIYNTYPIINANATNITPTWGSSFYVYVNITDDDLNRDVDWLNFTIIYPNATKLLDNINGTRESAASDFYNSSSVTIPIRGDGTIGTYTWYFNYTDNGTRLNSDYGTFTLTDSVAPNITQAVLNKSSVYSIAFNQVWVKTMDNRSDTLTIYATVDRPTLADENLTLTLREDHNYTIRFNYGVLGNYNITKFFSFDTSINPNRTKFSGLTFEVTTEPPAGGGGGGLAEPPLVGIGEACELDSDCASNLCDLENVIIELRNICVTSKCGDGVCQFPQENVLSCPIDCTAAAALILQVPLFVQIAFFLIVALSGLLLITKPKKKRRKKGR